jgi:TonB family protein
LVACIGGARRPSEHTEPVAREDWTVPSGGAERAAQPVAEPNSSGSNGVGGSATGQGQPRRLWRDLGPSRWQSALENYVPTVQPRNQTAINTARHAYANYLNAMHNRIHPLFTDKFLAMLDHWPASHPLNNEALRTEVEIVLNRESGDLVRLGVTHSSGVRDFDLGVIQMVERAAPFGAPPPEIVSPDGNVYVHWEFHRNKEACSTFNVRPFLLKASAP